MINELEPMIGRTFVSVIKSDKGDDELIFKDANDKWVKFYHCQDCCESVGIEDIIGDLSDLENSPILVAEEISSEEDPKFECYESYTWTFYRFATTKGTVTVRWLGTSNGYYSEGVSVYFS